MRLGYTTNGTGPDAVARAVQDALAGKPATLVLADVPTPTLGRAPRSYRVDRLKLGTNPFEANRPCLRWCAPGTSDPQSDAGRTVLFSHAPLDPVVAAARCIHYLLRHAIQAREEFDVKLPEIFRPLEELELGPHDTVFTSFELDDELTNADQPTPE